MKSTALVSTLALALAALGTAACTSSPPIRTGAGGTTGTGGTPSGAAGTTGAAGAPSGAAGTTGTAGAPSGEAGTTGAAGAPSGAAGTTGTAGSPVGTAGVTGAAGTAPDGGTTGAGGSPGDGGTSSYKPFVCPAGPFGAQMATKTTAICTGFAFNYGYNEGPTWIATQNAFFFSNFVQGNGSANKTAGDIIKVTLNADGTGICEVWVHDAGCNGLGVAADGNLLGACHGPRAVMKYDVVTKQGTIVSSMAGGKMYDSPNDLVSTRNGNIYFSNTQYELGGRPPGGIGSALVRIDPAGMATVVATGGLNGMALSPDEKLLYVVQLGVWNINPDGSPGTKTNMGGPGGDGIAMDCAGNLVNTNNQYGTNAAFGGPDGKTLIVAGGGKSVKLLQMTVPGFP